MFSDGMHKCKGTQIANEDYVSTANSHLDVCKKCEQATVSPI